MTHPQSYAAPVGGRTLQRRQPGTVVEQISKGQVPLAGLRKLGPEAGNRGIPPEHPAVHEHGGAGRGYRLGHRHHAHHRVLGPGSGAGRIHIPAPKVDEKLPVHGDREYRAHLSAGFEVLGERLANRAETPRATAVDGDHGLSSSATQHASSRRSNAGQ